MERPPAGYGDPTCAHLERREGICDRCGHCQHEVILNGACFLCGSTDLDLIANTSGPTRSPEKPAVIPASQLVRKKP
jgi:hypothetical protein